MLSDRVLSMNDDKIKRGIMYACKRYIDAHFREPLDLRFLANRFAYSYSVFRKDFKDVCKYTPHQYICMRRIQFAAQYLREGHSVTEAAEYAGFETLAGFYKAFKKYYGITPKEFFASRGMALMTPPTPVEREDFFLVGYVLEPVEDMKEEERGAFWIVRSCPDLPYEEYARIGGGADMAAIWAEGANGGHYLMGPPVDEVRYVPAGMEAQPIPGGRFLEFPVPFTKDIFILYENVRVTWYYARYQWLPGSHWEEDTTRRAFEYYGVGYTSILIPVRERETTIEN